MKIASAVFLILVLSFPAMAEEEVSLPTSGNEAAMQTSHARLLLNSFAAIADGEIGSVLRYLKLLSGTEEVKSGEWDRMQGLLNGLGDSGIHAAAVWYARPDGSSYAVGKGLTDENLRDRSYFPGLMDGSDVVGDLVISKSTGRKAAIVAVPVKRQGKVTGALGVSLSVDEISRSIEEKMGLPEKMVFYALNAQGQTSIHRSSSLLFAFPSDVGSRSLREAVKEMLSKQEGTVRYEFNGDKTVVFMKSPLTGWVFAMGVLSGSTRDSGSGDRLSPILSELEKQLADIFGKMNADLSSAVKGLSEKGLEGTDARRILHDICLSNPYTVDCAIVDRRGRMLMVEPKEYRRFEGADISKQEQVVRLRESGKPVMSKVFLTVEGIDAVDIEHPVYSPQGDFIGSISLLIKPDQLFSDFATPLVQGLPVDIWAMQRDGRIIYDPDAAEIGRMLFEDPLYKPFPQLLSLGRTIADQKKGTGSYEFLGSGLKKAVRKDACWTTVGLYGTEWRLVVTSSK